MLGKKPADLQTGITISEDSITGTLKHVTNYTGYDNSVVEQQSGNYIALKFDVKPADTITTVEVVGGTKGPVELKEDKTFIGRIANKDKETIKVTCKNNTETLTKTYSLKGLTLQTQ